MRIVYLHPKSWNGEYPVLRKLVELGHDVAALEEKRGLGRKRLHASHYRDPGDRIRTLWYDPRRGWKRLLTWPLDRVFRRAFDGRNLVHRMLVILEAVRAFRPELVICGDGFSYAIPAGLLKRLGLLRCRVVVRYIGGDILYSPEAELGRRRTPLVGWLIRQGIAAADGLLPVSPLLAEVLMREGADTSRLKVCPSPLPAAPGTLAEIHSDPVARDAVRRRYGFQPHTQVVITLSSNQKGKGVHLMAAAWPMVLRAVPQARWLLAGPPHPWLDEGVWPELCKQPEVVRSVIATGALERDAAFAHLAAADLNVNPSLCEGLNMVAVEAAAVGTPTVTSDGAGVAAWVSQYGAGAVVRTGDVDELAAAVVDALLDTDRISAWRANCPRLAEGFGVERVARQLVAM